MWQQLLELLNTWTKELSDLQIKLLLTLLTFIVMWGLQRIFIRSITRLQSNLAVRYTWRKTTTYIIYLLGVIAIGFIWSNEFDSLATFLGLLSAGLAIAFKDPITNVAGWYFILIQKPFKVGDRVQVGQQMGDVVDINLFQFTIIEIGNWVADDQSTGRIIHIPNAKVFNTAIANYNEGLDYIWNEIPILVTYESDWQLAKQLLLDILNEHAPKISEKAQRSLKASTGKYLIYYKKLTPIVYTTIEDCGVQLTMRYLCSPKQRRNSASQLMEEILHSFNQQSTVDFAYPTRRTITSLGQFKGPNAGDFEPPAHLDLTDIADD